MTRETNTYIKLLHDKLLSNDKLGIDVMLLCDYIPELKIRFEIVEYTNTFMSVNVLNSHDDVLDVIECSINASNENDDRLDTFIRYCLSEYGELNVDNVESEAGNIIKGMDVLATPPLTILKVTKSDSNTGDIVMRIKCNDRPLITILNNNQVSKHGELWGNKLTNYEFQILPINIQNIIQNIVQ